MPTVLHDLQRSAHFYRRRGYNPLPSSRVHRHPVIKYAPYWDHPVEPTLIDQWPIHRARNLQLMCGARWNLAVIDLDGHAAVTVWDQWCRTRPVDRTWTVATASGRHLWFAVPAGLDRVPTGIIWDSGHRHQHIELLGDRHLVTAPPSLHHRTARPYRFTIGPRDLPNPAELPGWVLDLVPSEPAPSPLPPRAVPIIPIPVRRHHDRTVVLDAIGDHKLELAESWGLRVTCHRPSYDGWVECRSLSRTDSRPSCGFNIRSGYFAEPHAGLRLSLFDTAVALGRYPSWQDACDHLGSVYCRHRVGDCGRRA
jgi:hypothetical protein